MSDRSRDRIRAASQVCRGGRSRLTARCARVSYYLPTVRSFGGWEEGCDLSQGQRGTSPVRIDGDEITVYRYWDGVQVRRIDGDLNVVTTNSGLTRCESQCTASESESQRCLHHWNKDAVTVVVKSQGDD